MKTSVSLASAGEDFGRRKRLLPPSLLRLSQSRESRNCGIEKEREEERGRLIFVVRPESLLLRRRKGKGGRKDPFFFTRFSARGHASSSGRNNIGK